jgi:hypothetical protein
MAMSSLVSVLDEYGAGSLTLAGRLKSKYQVGFADT